jgi:dihydrodipicolinate synthase/N-acetylneuraminate lyase
MPELTHESSSVVVAGSSGESCALNLEERAQLVKHTRAIATANNRPDLAITIGCLAGSTREILDQARSGHANGADFALVLVPSVFHWSMTQKAIVDFFLDVADRSPIPIVIYNFPNLLSGLDVNQDMMDTLAAHPNMAGVKLTCGNISKMTRVAAQYAPGEFAAVSGQSDLIVSALAGGGAGTISGVVNLFPKASLRQHSLHPVCLSLCLLQAKRT